MVKSVGGVEAFDNSGALGADDDQEYEDDEEEEQKTSLKSRHPQTPKV